MIAYEHKKHMLLTLSTKGKIMDNVIKGLTFNSKRGAMFTILFIGLIVLVSWIELIDKSSSEYIDSALVQATTTFAVARGFNAIVNSFSSAGVFNHSIWSRVCYWSDARPH